MIPGTYNIITGEGSLNSVKEIDDYLMGLGVGDLQDAAKKILKTRGLPENLLEFNAVDQFKVRDQKQGLYKPTPPKKTGTEDPKETAFYNNLGQLSNLEKRVLQIVRGRQLADFNTTLAGMREKVSEFRNTKQKEIEKTYSQQVFDHYFKKRDGSENLNQRPGMPYQIEPFPVPPTQSSLNEEVAAFGRNLLSASIKNIDNLDIKNAVSEQFNHEIGQALRGLTTFKMDEEINYYRSSYDAQAKGLLSKLSTNPTLSLKDLTTEYNKSVVSGINSGLLRQDEGALKSSAFTAEVRNAKKDQLNTAITPAPGATPIDNVQKAYKLIESATMDDVLTNFEANNKREVAQLQALNAENVKAVQTQTQTIADKNKIIMDANILNKAKDNILSGLKYGQIPTLASIQNLYDFAAPEERQKMHNDIQQGFSEAKFALLPTQLRNELIRKPEVLEAMFNVEDTPVSVKKFTDLNNELVKEEKKDPVKYLINQGLIQNVQPLDLASPQGLLNSLKNRADVSNMVYAQTGVRNTGLTAEEIEFVGEQFKSLPRQESMDLVGSIYMAYGDKAYDFFSEFDKKGYRTLSEVGKYYASDNKDAANNILLGSELIKTKQIELPRKQIMSDAIRTIMAADILKPTYLDDTSMQKTMNAAQNIFAAKLSKAGIVSLREVESLDPESEDLLRESIAEAFNGGTLRLGKSYIESPFPGATADQINGLLDTITLEDVSNVKQFTQLVPGPFTFQDDAALQKFLKNDVSWISIGDGNYYLAVDKPKIAASDKYNIELLQLPSGAPLVIDLKRLMKGTDKNDVLNVPSVIPTYVDVMGSITQSEASVSAYQRELIKHERNMKDIQDPDNFNKNKLEPWQ